MERIIFDNYYSTDRYNECAEYLLEEYGDDNNWTSVDDIPSQDIWDELSIQERLDWDDVMEIIEDYDTAYRYILYGSVGRWDGTYTGAKVFESIREAIEWAIEDCDYIKIYDDNGRFCIQCSHHDGTNYFTLKAITDNGLDYLVRWEDNWNDTRSEAYINKQIIKRYSRHLNFANIIYGTV